MKDYQYLLDELKSIQHYAQAVCDNNLPFCAVDRLFQAEWVKLRDYVDTAVSNLDAYTQSGEVDTDIVEQLVFTAVNNYIEAATALRDGYVVAMANCTEADATTCPLVQRARQVLEEEHILIPEETNDETLSY